MFVLLSALLSVLFICMQYGTAAQSFDETQLEEAATPSTTTDGGINHDDDLPALPDASKPIPTEWVTYDNIITFPQVKQAQHDDGMEAYTIRELKKMASFYGVKRYSSLTKAQLITAIRTQVLYPQAVYCI